MRVRAHLRRRVQRGVLLLPVGGGALRRAFGAFEEAGLEDDAAVIETGAKFASTVLAMGGGVAPLEVFTKFRGREPSVEALLRHNGLVAASA